MEGFGYSVAVVVAGVFVWAAAPKLARSERTAAGFRALRLPAASFLARAVPLLELALAGALLAVPRTGGVVSVAVLAAFSGVLIRALVQGVTAGCNCFGATGSAGRLSWVDVLRNGLLATGAALAASAPDPVVPRAGAIAAAGLAAGAAAALLAVVRRRDG